jgi:hypothetical protein
MPTIIHGVTFQTTVFFNIMRNCLEEDKTGRPCGRKKRDRVLRVHILFRSVNVSGRKTFGTTRSR